jgi:hypothetical protein
MKNKETNNELVTVTTVYRMPTLSMVQAHLKEAGIRFFLQNELMAQLYGNAFGGVGIQVSAADAEKARKLLAEGEYFNIEYVKE